MQERLIRPTREAERLAESLMRRYRGDLLRLGEKRRRFEAHRLDLLSDCLSVGGCGSDVGPVDGGGGGPGSPPQRYLEAEERLRGLFWSARDQQAQERVRRVRWAVARAIGGDRERGQAWRICYWEGREAEVHRERGEMEGVRRYLVRRVAADLFGVLAGG